MSDVVRIDSLISFHLSKLSKAKFSLLYDIYISGSLLEVADVLENNYTLTFKSRLASDPFIQTHAGIRMGDSCFYAIDVKNNLVKWCTRWSFARWTHAIKVFFKNRLVWSLKQDSWPKKKAKKKKKKKKTALTL